MTITCTTSTQCKVTGELKIEFIPDIVCTLSHACRDGFPRENPFGQGTNLHCMLLTLNRALGG